MKRCLTITLVLSFSPSLIMASWIKINTKELVCDSYSEVIIVGKLSNVKKHFMSISYEEAPYPVHYDLGYIVDGRVLKNLGRFNSRLGVIFPSEDQDKSNPLRHMHKSHKEGEEGIWILRRDSFSSHYVVFSYPEVPLPLSKEQEVLDVLNSCSE